MRNLIEFTADLLSHAGARVDRVEEGLEVLLPNEVAQRLSIPEHIRVTASPEGKGGIFLSYDSELCKKLGGLLKEEGRFAVIDLPALALRLEKIEERLAERILLQNAVFELTRKEEGLLSYLVGYFRYAARSDERQEGIVAVLINERNLSVRPFQTEWLDPLDTAASAQVRQTTVSGQVINALLRSGTEMAREALRDFIKSLERRLQRDIARVHGYYQTLIEEAMQISPRKAAEDSESEKTQNKITAIETERKWKVQDLIGKYRLDLQMEPISFIRIETKGPIFWLTLKRRKGKRVFPLTYNPVAKAIDPFPCEGCFHPRKVSFVCDDFLHLLCPLCFAPCTRCGKARCHACHPKDCPRCGPEPKRL